MLTLTVLGCNGLYPSNGINTSGYLLQTKDSSLLLDVGSGVFSALKNIIAPEKIDAIFISHLHHDHISDLGVYNYYLESLAKKGMLKNKIKLFVKNDESFVYRLIEGLSYFEICDFSTESNTKLNELDLSFYKMKHPVLTHGINVKAGDKSVSYTADSNVCEALENAIKNSNLAVCHAPFTIENSGENKPHASANAVCKIAKKYDKKVLISHFIPDADKSVLYEECHVAGANFEFVSQGKIYTV